ncbi:MAG: hypothetical protein JXK07_00890 [Spirochaetes bacterium]|nr:hypothetical protein [Spirochaetota bacterium]
MKIIKALSKDNLSGATEIEAKALEAFTYFIGHTQDGSLSSFRNKITTLCIQLAQAQSSMSSLFNLSNDILHLSHAEKSVKGIKESLTTYFTNYDSTDSILRYAVEFLLENSCIVTHSRSSLVLQILTKINPGIHVICTESRPLNEGRRLASELASSGARVTLVVDTAIYSLLPKAECVLVGADAVTPLGVINKIGTMGIAAVATEQGIPVYVATSLHKLFPYPLPISLRDYHEVWEQPPGDIEVENFYFDLTPFSHINNFLTEKGVLDPSKITENIQSIQVAPQLLSMLAQRTPR